MLRSIELFKSLTGDYGGKVGNVSSNGILALFERPETGRPLRHPSPARRRWTADK